MFTERSIEDGSSMPRLPGKSHVEDADGFASENVLSGILKEISIIECQKFCYTRGGHTESSKIIDRFTKHVETIL